MTGPDRRPYRIEIASRAAREFRKLDPLVQRRLSRKIDSLSLDPRPPGVKTLRAGEGVYRIRDGDCLLIYSIKDRKLLILVLSVGNRREIYKR